MKTIFFLAIIALAVVFSGCMIAPKNNDSNTPMPGSDRDSHGCIGSAGYSWCEAKQECLRQWEEECSSTIEALAQTYCGEANVASVAVCGEYVKVASSLIGGGSTFYKFDGTALGAPIVCPVVGPDSMSDECRQLTMGSNCIEQTVCGADS